MNGLREKLTAIKMVLFDVDGVLSDGQVYIDNNGVETKSFYVRDGIGIRMLVERGIICGVITGRSSKIVDIRMKELGMQEIHQGVKDKLKVFNEILDKYKLSHEECVFVGDDVPDIEVFQKAGIAIAPGDADERAKKYADIVMNAPGGKGAVRELTDMIMDAHEWELFVP